MDILYRDNSIIVCIKPAGVLSTDEEGGLPGLLRTETGINDIRTVHRLDRVVSGLMVLAVGKEAASELSRQVREGIFDKRYLAVVHGELPESGKMTDLLIRSKEERKTYVTDTPSKDSRPAELNYRRVAVQNSMSLAEIELITGRTHQIRCQFSSRNYPLVGDRKYSVIEDGCNIALWSEKISFLHPETGEKMQFLKYPEPSEYPWSAFCVQLVNNETSIE